MNDLLSFLDQGAGYQKNACNVKSNSDTIEISTPRDRQKRKNMEASNIEKKAFERLNEFLLKRIFGYRLFVLEALFSIIMECGRLMILMFFIKQVLSSNS